LINVVIYIIHGTVCGSHNMTLVIIIWTLTFHTISGLIKICLFG